MLPEGTIRADHIWKRFRADRRRRLARDQLEVLGERLKGRAKRGWRWALKDIDFKAEPGEAVGLVGINGSGKSTLLRILGGVMYPYAGKVAVSGRIGALIEVKAGIHPDLTGRENIVLYGILMGLSRRDVERRLDEIVEFAELEDAIDRQVKFYSSGMQMRLGFSVAAHLEPDVLLVDEVLAVGDASFQQKCLHRMGEVISSGTTLMLVSHDLTAVEATCERSMWIHGGVVQHDGASREVLTRYRAYVEGTTEIASSSNDLAVVRSVSVGGPDGSVPRTQEELKVSVDVGFNTVGSGELVLGVSEGTAQPIFAVRLPVNFSQVQDVRATCVISRLPLPKGRYYIWLGAYRDSGNEVLRWTPHLPFDVQGPELDSPPRAIALLSPVHVDAAWQLER